jgi:DNA-directed RNA polymerase specialized sigma24 family protein
MRIPPLSFQDYQREWDLLEGELPKEPRRAGGAGPTFASFFAEHYRAVLGVFLDAGIDPLKARDLARKAFLRMFRDLPEIEDETTAETYLLNVVDDLSRGGSGRPSRVSERAPTWSASPGWGRLDDLEGVEPFGSADESLPSLLEELPREVTERYAGLNARRQAETLTSAERRELLTLTDQIEEYQLRRLDHLTDLARARNLSLADVVEDLGIRFPVDA